MKLRLAAAVLLAASTEPALALADDVPPPPTDCPPGSEGRTGHEGEACVATTCANDGECTGGKRCLEQALCVRVQTGKAGRHQAAFSRPVASRVCEPGKAACLDGAKCETAKRCVDPAKRTSAAPATAPATASAIAPATGAPLATAADGAAPPAAPSARTAPPTSGGKGCAAAPVSAMGGLGPVFLAFALSAIARRRARR